MSNAKSNSLSARFTLWLLWLLWRLVKWAVLKIWFRCLPNKMHMAPSEDAIEAFYKSKGWYRLSLWAKDRYGRECMKCKKNPEAFPGLKLNTDHIQPVRYYWHKRKDRNNLQVLCAGCNKAKGSVDMTDYRGYRPGKTPMPQSLPVPRRQFHIVNTLHWRERGSA